MFDFSHPLSVCYDRAPKHRLALTFILSALWHGVYPGYYFTFITAIPVTMAARAVSTWLEILMTVYNWYVLIFRQIFANNSGWSDIVTPFVCLFPPGTEVFSHLFSGQQRLEAGLRRLNLGSHSAGHLLHGYAFSSSCSRAHFGLLQVRYLSSYA